MSKILYPLLRLGFLVAPPQLVDTLVKVRAVMDQHSPAIDEAHVVCSITEGFFRSHVKRIRELYAQRRVFFIEQFQKWLGDYFVWQSCQPVCTSSPGCGAGKIYRYSCALASKL